MKPILENDIILVTDGVYKGNLFVVKKSWIEGDLCLCKCWDMYFNSEYYFDNLCCVPIGRILTTFQGIDFYLKGGTGGDE